MKDSAPSRRPLSDGPLSYNPLSYSRVEIESFLPTGWALTGDGGSWDPAKKVWRATLRDGAHLDWPLEVAAADARRTGSLEALREAVDRVFRGCLGKPTRGLGLGG